MRQARINELIAKVLDSEGRLQEEAFEELTQFASNDDIDNVYAKLTGRIHAQGVFWLVKYLTQISRPWSFEKLFLLADSANEVIREEACRGIEKIPEDVQSDFWIGMLEKPWAKGRAMAIKSLGELRLPKAVGPLQKLFERNFQDEDLAVKIISALGKIQDLRTFHYLEELAMGRSGKIQQEALLAMGKFTRRLSRRYLRKCLASPNAQIREMVYLNILRYQGRRWERYIAKALRQEREAQIQANILSSLRAVQTEILLKNVFALTLQDESYHIKVMAMSVIRRLKSRMIFKWLKKMAGIKLHGPKIMSLRFLAEYENSPEVFDVFRRNIETYPHQEIKLACIEHMGQLRDPRRVAYLLDLVKNGGVFSCAAALSLCRGIRPHELPLAREVERLHREKNYLPVEVFLKYIYRLPRDYQLPDEFFKKIETLILSEAKFVRYLAVRCLPRIKKRDYLGRLLFIARKDPEAPVREAAIKSMKEILTEMPQAMIGLLAVLMQDSSLFPVVYRLISEMPCDEVAFERIVFVLITLFRDRIEQDAAANIPEAGRLLVLLRKIFETNRYHLVTLLSSRSEWDDFASAVAVRVMSHIDLAQIPHRTLLAVIEKYRNASEKYKPEYLKFFKKLKNRPNELRKAVFDDLAKPACASWIKDLEEIVGAWIYETSSPRGIK